MTGRLAEARALFDRGDAQAALVIVEAALDADPEFLAARALRELILAGAAAANERGRGAALELPSATAPSASDGPVLDAAGIPAIERRARQRRKDRCLTAMRESLAAGEFDVARRQLDEARSLESHDAAVALASAELKLHESREASHNQVQAGGSRLAIGLWLVVIVVGGSWVASQRQSVRIHRQPSRAGEVPRPVDATPLSRAQAGERPEPAAVGRIAAGPASSAGPTAPQTEALVIVPSRSGREPATSIGIGPHRPLAVPRATPTPAERVAGTPVPAATVGYLPAPPPVTVPPIPPNSPARSPALAETTQAVPPAPPAASSQSPPLALTPAAVAIPSGLDVADDERLVRQVLQRYEAAYEALDARSAQGVWPAVNAEALARAFSGLSAQELRFDDCGVNIRGTAALVTCRGVVRYVTKVGRQEPRMDSRVWTFALEKQGPQWLIASARAAGR